jgi:CheY-like chemotaxis protein
VRCTIGSAIADDDAGAAPQTCLAFSVADEGPGIAREHIETLFTPFARGDVGAISGSGLGLALSRRYAEAMGGRVMARGEPGVGSTFCFTLPVEVPATQSKAAPPPVVISLAQGLTVTALVVDDSESNRVALSDMLRQAGFTVLVAADGPEALVLFSQAQCVDVVLLDKEMPGMDGLACMTALRREKPNGPPVVMVTAAGLADEGPELLRRGADGFVPKPVERSVLLDEIRRVTGIPYVYEEATNDRPPEDADVSAAMLAELPSGCLQALAKIVRRGDVMAMRAYVTELAKQHAGVGAHLQALVERYEYVELLRICEGELV